MLDISSLSAADAQAIAAQLFQLQQAQGGDVKKPKKSAKRKDSDAVKYLTEQELERFFRAIESVRDTAIFRVMYHRGLRAAEIGMINFADWNERDDRLTIRRLKGSSGGEYHLCKSEIKALKAWKRIRGSEPGPMFPSRVGSPISQQMLDVLMKHYGAIAGLPADKCHCHTLKHSCGTHLLNRGESIEDVQDHLGHREVKNTMIYARFTNKRRHERDRRLRDW
jgi:type 1 fimbriae regulatory protein FimB